jgi:hypothetical protein
MRCGCEVPGMILLLYLKGAKRLESSKDMSVHVSTCTRHDFNALTPVVCGSCGAYETCVSTSSRKNE